MHLRLGKHVVPSATPSKCAMIYFLRACLSACLLVLQIVLHQLVASNPIGERNLDAASFPLSADIRLR